LNLYLDASALVKRYVDEPSRATVNAAMSEAEVWSMSRVGFVETYRAVWLRSGEAASERFREEWSGFAVIGLDEDIMQRAAALATQFRLRSLDAIHLASASIDGPAGVIVVTWDGRLHAAARALGHATVPERLA